MVDGGLLLIPNLVLAGNLNFTIGVAEIWGGESLLDPLAHFFSHLIVDNGLVDLAPPYAGPTWRNGRGGVEGISKRLDRFPISSSLVPSLLIHRVWTVPSEVSNHYPVCLEWGGLASSHNYPFKFNHALLLENDFCLMVKDLWASWEPDPLLNDMKGLSLKLKALKAHVKDLVPDPFCRNET